MQPSEWQDNEQDPGPLTSRALGYFDRALPGNPILPEPLPLAGGPGWGGCKDEEVRLGCGAQGWQPAKSSHHSPGLNHQPGWLGSAFQTHPYALEQSREENRIFPFVAI